MKNIIYLFVGILFFGCSNIKSVYGDEKLDNNESLLNFLEKNNAKEDNKSIIFFTSGFENDTIELINGKDILFKLPIETISSLGFAYLQTVSNLEDVKINILSRKSFNILLNKEELKKYKFIYIKRDAFKRKKYFIEYSNVKRYFY